MKSVLRAGVLLLPAAFILLFPPACKKTVTEIVTDTFRHAWQPVPLFNNYGEPALSSFNVGDTTLVVGGSFGVIQVPVNGPGFNSMSGFFLPGTSVISPALEAPYVDAVGCSFTTATSLYVESVPPHSQNSILTYDPSFTPGAYGDFQQGHTYPTEGWPAGGYPLIRDRYVLTPVEAVDTSFRQIRFDLISFDSAQVLGPYGFGDTPHVKRIIVSPAPGTQGFFYSNYFCAAWYDKFFVFYRDQFFRIDTAGNVKAFGYTPAPYSKNYGIGNMFTYGNTLFVNSGGIIFGSTDQGESWRVYNDFSGTNAGFVIYRNIGKDLYATVADLDMQIWKVVIDGNNFSFSEINNDGLESNLVTSLTKCGRYVFATTPAGVFYRDTAYFDQLKTPIR